MVMKLHGEETEVETTRTSVEDFMTPAPKEGLEALDTEEARDRVTRLTIADVLRAIALCHSLA